MEPFGSDDFTEQDEPIVVPPLAPLSTGPLQYDVLDDDDWED